MDRPKVWSMKFAICPRRSQTGVPSASSRASSGSWAPTTTRPSRRGWTPMTVRLFTSKPVPAARSPAGQRNKVVPLARAPAASTAAASQANARNALPVMTPPPIRFQPIAYHNRKTTQSSRQTCRAFPPRPTRRRVRHLPSHILSGLVPRTFSRHRERSEAIQTRRRDPERRRVAAATSALDRVALLAMTVAVTRRSQKRTGHRGSRTCTGCRAPDVPHP